MNNLYQLFLQTFDINEREDGIWIDIKEYADKVWDETEEGKEPLPSDIIFEVTGR
jgi:hypothetical protein